MKLNALRDYVVQPNSLSPFRFGMIGAVCLLTAVSGTAQERSSGSGRGGRPGSKPGEVITRPDLSERWKDELHVGGVAPEFTLPLLPKPDAAKRSAAGRATRGEQPSSDPDAPLTVALRDLRSKQPAVLIFGSMTCPPFRGQLEGVDAVYKEFKDRARFLFIYVREAHPDSVLSVIDQSGGETLLKIAQPADAAGRAETAAVCQRTVELEMPIAVDGIDNRVGKAYAGWPNRMVVVGTDGRVLFASDPVPRGTDARRLRTWLEENL